MAEQAQRSPTGPGRNRRLWAIFLRHRRAFVWGALFVVLTNLLVLRIPREIGRAIQLLKDTESPGTDLSEVQELVIGHAVAIILLAIGAILFRILSRTRIFNAGRLIEYDLRNAVFGHLTRLSPSYYQSMATGDLTSRVINDTTYVRLLFGVGFLHAVNTVVAVMLAVSLMLRLDIRLTLTCLIPFPVVLFLVMRLARALHHQTRRVQEKLADLSAQCQEDLSGVATVKAYAAEAVETGRFEQQAEEYVDENMRLARIRGFLMPLMTSIGGLGMLLVLYLGGRAVIVRQTIELGQFIEFSGYVAAVTWPFMAMGWVISVWERGTAAFDRVNEVLDSRPEIVAPDPDEVSADVRLGRIEFHDVSFCYDEQGPEVLREIDLTIESGSRVGIIGRSGSGKTTLVQLIARMYDVTSGEVRVDGQPISSIPLERLRCAIGYAPQEPFLFSTSLARNIRLGLDARAATNGRDHPETLGGNETDGAVERAIEAVRLTADLLALSDGLDTMVGERGITLSGGQKQRVALARAILMKPRILLLDDSLSSVDTRTEREILDALDEAIGRRTAVVVTHRFNVLELMDEIVVMDQGRIVERGAHAELASRPGGAYAAMVRRQRLQEEIAAL